MEREAEAKTTNVARSIGKNRLRYVNANIAHSREQRCYSLTIRNLSVRILSNGVRTYETKTRLRQKWAFSPIPVSVLTTAIIERADSRRNDENTDSNGDGGRHAWTIRNICMTNGVFRAIAIFHCERRNARVRSETDRRVPNRNNGCLHATGGFSYARERWPFTTVWRGTVNERARYRRVPGIY